MAYTTQEAYNIALGQADKMGSDYFTLPQVLVFFKTATYDFLARRIKVIEKTQEITEDIKALLVVAPLAAIVNTEEPNCYMVAQPSNFHTRLRIAVQYTDQIMARMPRLERHGEANSNTADPLNSPTKHYPLILQLADTYNIYTDFPVLRMFLTYIKHPTFGTAANPTGQILNLPAQVVEEIIKITVNDYMVSKGDPRSQIVAQNTESFRKVRKE